MSLNSGLAWQHRNEFIKSYHSLVLLHAWLGGLSAVASSPGRQRHPIHGVPHGLGHVLGHPDCINGALGHGLGRRRSGVNLTQSLLGLEVLALDPLLLDDGLRAGKKGCHPTYRHAHATF